jgi:CheY-like chemotaxis protein
LSLPNVVEVERRDEAAMEGSDAGARVLIVDDETDMRHALSLLVESHGYEIIGEAGTGVEAIDMASQDPPDVIVLDYMMPGMDGAEAALRLRSIAPDAKIIAFSAILTDKPDWADAYLNKDRISQIASVIKEASAS